MQTSELASSLRVAICCLDGQRTRVPLLAKVQPYGSKLVAHTNIFGKEPFCRFGALLTGSGCTESAIVRLKPAITQLNLT